jgi:integrase/recombinase XerC
VQLFDDRYGIAHLTGFEGDPRRRPLTVDELEAFFACCDARIARRRGLGRKGELSAWRDQAVFKVMFAWGLRRAETASLDVVDFRAHAALPEFGEFAALHVRYGKSMPGGPPRRRTVLTVFDWAVEVVEQYLTEVRPALRPGDAPAVFVTERATRMAPGWITDRFAELRDEAGLASELTPHCLRHSYVTHLAEHGYADRFIQDQVGHSHAATTAIYLSVSDDFKNRMVRNALDRQLTAIGGTR